MSEVNIKKCIYGWEPKELVTLLGSGKSASFTTVGGGTIKIVKSRVDETRNLGIYVIMTDRGDYYIHLQELERICNYDR